MSNICVIGTGYVGLVTGVCFADLGNSVHCLDINEKRIKNLKNGVMPIYEYACKQCGHQFEELVRGDEKPACPACGRGNVERQMSVPAAHTAASTSAACPARDACGMSGCCGQGCGLTGLG